MSKSLLLICSLAGLFFSSQTGATGDRSLALLEKMRTAIYTQNFQAQAQFLRDGSTASMHYRHGLQDGQRIEHMTTHQGSAHEVVRRGNKVTCLLPDSQRAVVDHRPSTQSFLVNLPEHLPSTQAFYHYQAKQGPVIAGHASWVVDIVPKDAYRYARTLWIDRDSYLPLKIDVYNEQKNLVEQVRLAEIKLSAEPISFDLPAPEANTQVRHIHRNQPEPVDNARFILSESLPGYELVLFSRMRLPDSGHAAEHMLLSDGYSAISVYWEQDSDLSTGLNGSDSVNAYSKSLADGSVLTAIGEVPAAAVRWVVDHSRLKTTDHAD